MNVAPVIMFHHFCDARHPRGQGALDAGELHRLLAGRPGLLSADEWLARARASRLEPGDTCVSLDDNLRCQYDVALPVLEDLGLKALWFVQTGPLAGELDQVELHRYFRTAYFARLDDFYDAFEARFADQTEASRMAGVDVDGYLAEFPFYSRRDRAYRYVRNHFPAAFSRVMQGLLEQHVGSPGTELEFAL